MAHLHKDLHKDLHNAFPNDAKMLHALKAADPEFQALAARFDELDEEAANIDAGDEVASDERLETIKKQRLAILDEIAVLIATHKII